MRAARKNPRSNRSLVTYALSGLVQTKMTDEAKMAEQSKMTEQNKKADRFRLKMAWQLIE
jgi:hypothetical protein